MSVGDCCADVPYQLIQSIRLVHALMESSYRVHVPSEHADKFSRLREVFGAEFAVGIDGVPALRGLTISHREPRTAIGTVERPLIFPHAIVRRCRELWPAQRGLRCSFAGLITDVRREVLDRWVRRAFPSAPGRVANRTLAERVQSKIRRLLGDGNASVPIESNDLVIWSSDKGRQFPGKAWDEDYQRLLARSQFVLCPSGDYVWSYRFFEAMLCGAVPIVEADCPAYEGFRYRTMADVLGDVQWNASDAEHNFALCVSRLTIPTDQLDAEIASLLTRAT